MIPSLQKHAVLSIDLIPSRVLLNEKDCIRVIRPELQSLEGRMLCCRVVPIPLSEYLL